MKKIVRLVFVVLLMKCTSYASTNQPQALGSIAVNGVVQYPPSLQTISTVTVISPSAALVVIQSTGGPITMAGFGLTTPSPVISTTTALNGQYLILMSTNSSGLSTVTISSGSAAGVHLGAATRAIQANSVLTLIYNAVLNIWQEVSYGSN